MSSVYPRDPVTGALVDFPAGWRGCLLPRKVGGGKTAPCGKCKNCLSRYRAEETMRCLWEIKAAPAAWFFTGTFEGDAPERKAAQASWKAFLNRLYRRFAGVEFRFLRVPEFGSRNGRFHWHAILIASYGEGVKCPTVDGLDDAWRDGQKTEGFGKVKVLKGPYRDTSEGQVRKAVRYVVKYLRKGAGKAPAGKDAPNVSRSPHLGKVGVERVIRGNAVAQAVLDAFPGGQVLGVYSRVSPVDGSPVSLDEVAAGVPSVRVRDLWVPGVIDPHKGKPYRRLASGEFGAGIDPADLLEAEASRSASHVDPRDDPNRLVVGPGGGALVAGLVFNSVDYGQARAARAAVKRKAWWSAPAVATAAQRAEFARSVAEDAGLGHVHGVEDEDSGHWFGEED